MGPTLIVILALQLFYPITLSKVLNVPQYAVNSINKLTDYTALSPAEFFSENDGIPNNDNELSLVDVTDDYVPVVETEDDRTELKFRQPIKSVNVDYARNVVGLKFYENDAKSMVKSDPIENERKKSIQENFLRFGKRSYEEYPFANSLAVGFGNKNIGMRLERSHQNSRDARGDNFMRFGRSVNSKNDFMRFGRGNNDFMRFGRLPSDDFMRFGRANVKDNLNRNDKASRQKFVTFDHGPGQNFMRFGRTPTQDFMRFGRTSHQDIMGFGRKPGQDFIRFGRNPNQDFMRFGRDSFPKIPVNLNFMRYSRPDNFMRFGRTAPKLSNQSREQPNDKTDSKPQMGKLELKQAVKMIHEANNNADNENPVDKAIKVLFDKNQQQDENGTNPTDELNRESLSLNTSDNDDLDSHLDYFFKLSK